MTSVILPSTSVLLNLDNDDLIGTRIIAVTGDITSGSGETKDISRRMKEHFNPNNILNNKTENRHLYVAMYILGLENFTYEIYIVS